ncbi:MAG TPA: ATP-binding cassette domain-containing protein [Prolixibacteraceae bacterium]|nr:ATP-binding cassette domain-containing protein [Prolixibacteraceae bacterium]
MNEVTLNALINLFAIFSAISQSDKSQAVEGFSGYLQLHLGIAANSEYLRLFDELLDLYGVGGEAAFPIDFVQQAEKISTNIKGRLAKSEQVMVFVRFLELSKNGNIAKAEKLFNTLAGVFGIDDDELGKFKQFVFYKNKNELASSDFLLVDGDENAQNKVCKHIRQKNLNGEIVILRSALIDHFIFIFNGIDDITIEGNPIQPGRFYAFKEGNIIRGLRIDPIYYTDINHCFVDNSNNTSFVFEGENVEFKFKNSDDGLHSFSFSEKSGQLIAVMGGSGVGKSTLLNILNGNIEPNSGIVSINGTDIHRNKKAAEGLIGFVPQDDLLFEDLTVWENLSYNARLCFDELTSSEIDAKVERVLRELELFAFKDLKVGSPLKKFISGGQRKRLNVALELIREPAVLFVDEPTSGLSSTDSEKVMLLLKQQARNGKLIIVNIHQPSSAIFKLFDKLWIMDKGGRPIYTGNPLDAITYFKKEVNHVNADVCECANCGNVNPEQVLEIIETKMIDSSGNFISERRFSPQHWYSLFLEKMNGKRNGEKLKAPLPKTDYRKPGLLKQFRIFFERNLRIKTTDKQYLLINLLEAPLLAVIVAYFTRFAEAGEYVFFDNKSLISYLFMSIVVILFMGMSVSAEEIIKDRAILQRESFLNLSRFSYINSKVLFLLLLSAFQAFAFVLIGNMILEIQHMNFAYWMVLFSVAVFSNLLGLNISSAFDSVVTIYILIPLLLIPQILLCGVIVKFDDLQSKTADKDAVPIVGELMVSRWAFEALAVEQFKNNRYNAQFFDMEKEISEARFRSEILTTELIGQIDLVSGWLKNDSHNDDIAAKLKLVSGELAKLDGETPLPDFELIEKLNISQFNNVVAEQTKAHLEAIKKHFSNAYQTALKDKDRQISTITQSEGSDYLYNLKMKHHNKSLEALLLNIDSKEFYRYTANGIMQKAAPVYKEPDFAYGRAHFFAPYKNFFGQKINTLWFNVLALWSVVVLLYIALYFDWLRTIVHLRIKP